MLPLVKFYSHSIVIITFNHHLRKKKKKRQMRQLPPMLQPGYDAVWIDNFWPDNMGIICWVNAHICVSNFIKRKVPFRYFQIHSVLGDQKIINCTLATLFWWPSYAYFVKPLPFKHFCVLPRYSHSCSGSQARNNGKIRMGSRQWRTVFGLKRKLLLSRFWLHCHPRQGMGIHWLVGMGDYSSQFFLAWLIFIN